MELMRYLEIMRRWWWIGATAFAVTTVGTLAFVLPQPNVYEAASAFVVGPRSLNAEESVSAFDTLIRGEAINATYASIARSDLIRERAEARLDRSGSTSDLTVDAEVLTGTNVLSITVRGTDPKSVHDLAVAVGAETVAYVREVDQAYRLQTLDSPSLPRQPVGPNKTLTIAVGVSFGLLLSVSLSLAREYVARRLRSTEDGRRVPHPVTSTSAGSIERGTNATPVPLEEISFNGSDPQTAVCSEQEFRLRFRHEMIRAKRIGHPFSFGLVKVALGNGKNVDLSHLPARHDLMRIGQMLRSSLLDGDVLASLDDGRLAVVLPDMPAAEAEELLIGWKATIAWILYQDKGEPSSTLNVSTAVCEFRGDGFIGSQEAQRAARMLTEIRPAGDLASQASADRANRAGSKVTNQH